MNFDFIIPKEYCTTFQNIFSYIQKKYQVKFSRKSQIDSLLKKSKGKFFKTIHEVMNKCLNIFVKRLPQCFITNITIEYNQKYLSKTIIQVYQEFNNLPDFNSKLQYLGYNIDPQLLSQIITELDPIINDNTDNCIGVNPPF